MSTSPVPRGSSRGPRRPVGPRSGAGRRGPGTPRRGDRATGEGLAARELRRPDPPPAPSEPAVAAQPAAVEPAHAAELSGLRLLLDQLDALLRDPTLARALRSFAGRLAGGARGVTTAIADALRKLARLRLPRPLLLALLALALPLALLALVSSRDDERATPAAAQRPAAPTAGGAALPGVGMPDLRASDERPKPVRVALLLDRTYDTPALRRELSTLGAWLARNHAPGTRLTIIDAQSARASSALRASELAGARTSRPRSSATSAIGSALGQPRGRRLLVTLGSPAPRLGAGSTLRVTTRRGAPQQAPRRRGRRSRVAIDDRRPNALAASVARAIMTVSGQREQR